jgi:hypothetical protein
MKKTGVSSILIAVTLLTVLVIAEAQQPKKVPQIGYLTGSSPSARSARIEAFGQGLRELGYVEGKNIVIEYRYAEGKLDRMTELAADLVRLNVEVMAGNRWRDADPFCHGHQAAVPRSNQHSRSGPLSGQQALGLHRSRNEQRLPD